MTSLCVGDSGTPTLGSPVSIACDAGKLDDLTLFVNYTIK